MPVQQSFEADLQPLFDAEWSTARIWPPWYRTTTSVTTVVTHYAAT